jgi:hypothetical protein
MCPLRPGASWSALCGALMEFMKLEIGASVGKARGPEKLQKDAELFKKVIELAEGSRTRAGARPATALRPQATHRRACLVAAVGGGL